MPKVLTTALVALLLNVMMVAFQASRALSCSGEQQLSLVRVQCIASRWLSVVSGGRHVGWWFVKICASHRIGGVCHR